ncbi:hypothetical protein PH7735_00710 [Shimia thalassica]|jgi:hypothetical protein|uniref:Uncharacterized protein n=1 Tax=Shimia thalassica TaxID=1715693 RepID=A0A0P1I2P6_9RHOB|nr:hypothetical protein PH7735_00710 [Shimia thalassica]
METMAAPLGVLFLFGINDFDGFASFVLNLPHFRRFAPFLPHFEWN